MLKRIIAGARSLTADPWVLGAVGMILLTKSFEVIGQQVTAQAELLKAQIAEAQATVATAGAGLRVGEPEQNGGPVEHGAPVAAEPWGEPSP